MLFFLQDLSSSSEEEQRAQISQAMKSGFLFWIISLSVFIVCISICIIMGFRLYL